MDKRAITFHLDGPPQGKGRARSTKSGHHYTPEKTANYETRLAWTFRQKAGDWKPIEGPVKVIITAIFSPPKSFTTKQLRAIRDGELHPTVKPDWDNIGKLLDGLNGIAWVDDKQIVCATVRKYYSTTLPEGLTITIGEV